MFGDSESFFLLVQNESPFTVGRPSAASIMRVSCGLPPLRFVAGLKRLFDEIIFHFKSGLVI